MPEMSLKDLSDRATPGPWVPSTWGYQILTGDSWNTICTFYGDGKDHRLAQWEDGSGAKDETSNSHFIAALATAWFAGRLHDDTALADAVARARREAFEEAAKALEECADENDSRGNDDAIVYRVAADAIRALAANPPETRQTETGLKPGAWNDLVGPLVKRCEVAAAFGQEAVWNAKGADALGQILKHMADTLDSLIASDPPPPAIGNLVEEGR